MVDIITDIDLPADDDPLADLPEEVVEAQIDLIDLIQSENIAAMLDEAALLRIGDECKQGLEVDEASRAEWMDKHERAMELALQVAHERTYPWEGASNMIFPLITTGALQFNARALPAIIPGNNIVKCRVNGDDSGLYQAQVGPDGQPILNPQTGQPVMQEVISPGSKAAQAARVAQHMNWQLLDQMTEWEADTDTILLYLPIAGCAFRRMWYDPAKGRPCSRWIPATNLIVNMKARSIESAPRISEEFKLYPYEIVEKIRSNEYYYEGADPLSDLAGLDSEEDTDERDEQAAVCFVEQHCRIDLDEDGYPEPYTVIFHKETGQVMKITARYNEADIETNDFGDVVRITTVHDYIKYDFIPNPNNEFYGIGFGWLLGPINEQVNTTINQLNDAAHLQNMPMGFLGRGLRLKGGDMSFKPGEFKQVDNSGGSLRENIFQLSLEPPSQVLFQLLGLMINSGQDISSVKDIMMGNASQSIAPTTALTLVEQGTTQFNSIFKRVHRALKHEMKLLFTINSRTLDEREYFTFFDAQEQVSVSDYDPSTLNVTPVTDPNMAARALRQAKTQALMQIAQMFPDRLNRDMILADLLEAAEIENPQAYILPPPPPPQPSPDEQAKLMRAETDRFRAETDREAKGAKAIYDLMQAMKAKAEAETALTTAEIEGFIQQLNTIKGELNGPAIQGMAGAPGNNGGNP